ncbi:MmgE/PrpD family protein [Brevibacillus daliensis]|uniref:MmgE/PrpD family protein n=1 Tax=Brevibacillus daliensis TaxID=2892995 RepID=UPI00359F5D74
MGEKKLTHELARLVLSSQPEKDQAVMDAARAGVIDFLATSFAARDDEGVGKLWKIIESEGGHQVVPIIGQKRKASFLQAALLHGFIGHALDYDDVHSDVRGHPSTVILPALLSVAATSGLSGERFLASYIVGVEVMARLGLAIGAEHYNKGWHNTATLGTIAAGVAASYAEGHSIEQIKKVIGFAATQASGLRVQFGTETKPLHAGIAAQAGLLAVSLAEVNFGGTAYALDGKTGFFSVYGDLHQAERALLLDWGNPWKFADPGLWFKIYPFCSAAHHAADAARSLMTHHDILANEIEQVQIIFPPKGDSALVVHQPQTGEQGRFSVEYVVALALNGYTLTLNNFTAAPISEEINAFLPRIYRKYDEKIEPVPHAIPKGRFTIVEVEMKDGYVYRKRVDRPRGAPGNTLSQEDIHQKLEATVAFEQGRASELIKVVSKLKSEEDMKQLLTLL